ncbi:LCP family glycopolymer transferase [Tuberibacillus sp. Marseille-P3662]|uniref:LCP family glycopolymer transferase n=1 Tax=Tuberibacillus sp. Marseille-P3662 TaxID=1965358 RepID=UPI000A1CEA66|nr:LCP family protein [Tuberibacillus sp. Marseille-P3662]
MVTRQEKHKPKKKKWLWLVLLVVFLLVGGGGAYAYSIYSDVKSTVDEQLHEPVSGIDNKLTKKKVDKKDPINILLLGVDERKNDTGRSDTMIVMTLDPDDNRMQMVSIPRDTRTELVGEGPHGGEQDKINHAYAFGGSEMSVDTVENFLDISLDYYVKMNMEGLDQLVDAVGGITVTNDLAFTQNGHQFGTGELDLNGDQALAYARMRKQDPDGDFGRNERQRQVIKGIINQGAHLNVVNKIDDVMDVLGKNMTTNMQFEDMRHLATDYRSARKNMKTYEVSGQGTRINGIYYLQVPNQEVQKVHKMIKKYSS